MKKLQDEDNGYVDADPAERIFMVWELTKQAYAFAGIDAEQRLQRNVAKLIRPHGEKDKFDSKYMQE